MATTMKLSEVPEPRRGECEFCHFYGSEIVAFARHTFDKLGSLYVCRECLDDPDARLVAVKTIER